jgi:hypothetical protein
MKQLTLNYPKQVWHTFDDEVIRDYSDKVFNQFNIEHKGHAIA